jgi:small subunit ribosomal protein S10
VTQTGHGAPALCASRGKPHPGHATVAIVAISVPLVSVRALYAPRLDARPYDPYNYSFCIIRPRRERAKRGAAVAAGERIRIRMEGYDHEVLDRTAAEIVQTATDNGAEVHGPIPLPTRVERYTVLRSPHIDRKSREQFEIRTHKRLIDILKPNQKTIEALNKGLNLPPGVDIKIRVMMGG